MNKPCVLCGSMPTALTACEHDFCAKCLSKLGPVLADIWNEGAEQALDDAPGRDEYATSFHVHAEQLWGKNPFGRGTP